MSKKEKKVIKEAKNIQKADAPVLPEEGSVLNGYYKKILGGEWTGSIPTTEDYIKARELRALGKI